MRREWNRTGHALAVAGLVALLGCQATDEESWVVFDTGGEQLSLTLHGKEFAKTGQKFCLAEALPGAHGLSVREEDDGTTSFLINYSDPIVFRLEDKTVAVSLVESLYESKTRTATYTITLEKG